MNSRQIIKNISLLKNELNDITSMRSGSLSQQYNVCGSPGCKCKDPISPKKHGPYFKLRISRKGKNTTKFIKDENVELVKKQLENYKKFDQIIKKWIELANELADFEVNSKSKKM